MTILKVEEMNCDHCVNRIHNLLEELGMVHEVNLENKTVSIDGSADIIQKAIIELDDIGYTAVEK